MSIPNVDDYERIEDIEDVRTGDLVVSVSGNWYTVRADMKSAFNQLYCTIGGDAENGDSPLFFFDSEKFDYALRKKQVRTLPDKPGLWKDKDGDIWVSNGRYWRCISIEGVWIALSDDCYERCEELLDSAPFTPCKIVEES